MTENKSNFNELKIEGDISREPEGRQAGEHFVCNFSIKTQTKNGFFFLDCVAWHDIADKVLQYKKGDMIQLIGSLKQDFWEDKVSKEKKYKFKMNVSNVGFEKPERKKREKETKEVF